MTTLQPEAFDAFEDRSAVRAALPYAIGLLLLLAAAWFVYSQLGAVRGIRVDNEPRTILDVIPLPEPPPPPPPPPEPREKPPEPTEQPQPSPAEAPKAPQPQAAPVTIAAPAQAGTDSFGLRAGTGGGNGAPSSTGTCLGTNCGSAPGGGMSIGFYTRYLASELQDRVRRDEGVNRDVFEAVFAISVSPTGRVASARLVRSSGSKERDAKLRAILERVTDLQSPPSNMVFPQSTTVRGRRSL